MHRKLLRKALIALVAIFYFAPVPASWSAAAPLETVKSAVERAIQVLKDPELKAAEKKPERLARLKEIINPLFDFHEMARRCLGAHWRQRTPAEQEEFANLFRDFLEKTYADKVDLYSGEKVIFGRETTEQDYAQVDSTVISDTGKKSSVVYRLKRSDGQWKVYDAIVENVSIVNNYRSQFERVISKSSYQQLKDMLRAKAE